jgi:hypothetical protein
MYILLVFIIYISCYIYLLIVILSFFTYLLAGPLPAVVDLSEGETGAMDKVGSFWDVTSFKYSGLVGSNQIYVREESRRLWDVLEKLNKNDLLFVDGPPGVGKSTELYGWSMYKSRSTDKKVLWLHKGLKGICCIFLNRHRDTVYTLVAENLVNGLQNLWSSLEADIVVFDGFTSDTFKDLVGFFFYKKVILIGCSSYSTGRLLKSCDHEEIDRLMKRKYFTMNSWKFSEYTVVLKETDESVLREKYYYAGGSMRLMKYSSLDAIIVDIDKSFGAVTDYKTLFQGLTGDSGKESVNFLMQCFDRNTIPLSHYVTKKLSVTVGMEFVKMAKQTMHDNGSFQGWVFEFEIITLLKTGHLELAGSSYENIWKQGKEATFKYFSFDNDIISADLADDTWLIPLKYNFGCIDLMYYKNKGFCYAIQITRAESHEYKLDYIKPIVESFVDEKNKCEVNFVVIIPDGNISKFKLKLMNFINREKIQPFDDRWGSNARLSDFCKLFVLKDKSPSLVASNVTDSKADTSDGVTTRSKKQKLTK